MKISLTQTHRDDEIFNGEYKCTDCIHEAVCIILNDMCNFDISSFPASVTISFDCGSYEKKKV